MKAFQFLATLAVCVENMKMKSFICCLSIWLATAFASAQDILVTNEGEALKVYNLEVGSSTVFYQLEDKEDAEVKRIAKENVLVIRRLDGSKIDFSQAVVEAPVTVSTNGGQVGGITQVKPEDLSPEAKAANDALIARLNKDIEPIDETGKKNPKTGYAYGRLHMAENSVLNGEDIEITVATGHLFKKSAKATAVFHPFWKHLKDTWWKRTNPAFLFTVRNKTQQTIYLDLGNTFYVRLGKSSCLYIPSSTTTTNSATTGGGVNLGAVTGALGIGGLAGTLASGVNVGGSTSAGTSSTTYAQRYVAIAPLSSIELTPQYMFGNEVNDVCTGCRYFIPDKRFNYYFLCRINFSSDSPLLDYENAQYAEQGSPMKFSLTVSYSKTENCVQLKSQTLNMYLGDLYGYALFHLSHKNNAFTNDELIFDAIIKYKESRDAFPKE